MIGRDTFCAVLDPSCAMRRIFFCIWRLWSFFHPACEKNEIVALKTWGPEAIYKLYVRDFPVIVANDCHWWSAFFLNRKS
jgi:hypothetical protein